MSLPTKELLPKKAILIQKVVSKEECQKYIDASEKKGFTPATLNVGQKDVQNDEIRNNDRVVMDDKELAQALWNRIKDSLPAEYKVDEESNTVALGLSEKFRFYRYDPGQRFVRHYDGYEYGSVRYDLNKNVPQAKLTFLLYLNDGFEGGKTTFFNSKGKEILAVTPLSGSVLIYTHKLLHEGSIVTKGRKYVLRSDVMFAQPTQDSSVQGWLPGCTIS